MYLTCPACTYTLIAGYNHRQWAKTSNADCVIPDQIDHCYLFLIYGYLTACLVQFKFTLTQILGNCFAEYI